MWQTNSDSQPTWGYNTADTVASDLLYMFEPVPLTAYNFLPTKKYEPEPGGASMLYDGSIYMAWLTNKTSYLCQGNFDEISW